MVLKISKKKKRDSSLMKKIFNISPCYITE